MNDLFHITEKQTWEKAQAAGVYTAPSLQTEGFIHFSERDQVIGTANRFYQGQQGLVLLKIDRDRLQSKLQYDDVLGHGTFPHLYGPLNLDAVVQSIPFPPDANGSFDSLGTDF